MINWSRFIIVACFLVALGIGVFNLIEVSVLNKQLFDLRSSIGVLAEDQASTSAKVAITEKNIANQKQSAGKTQDQLLTSAVAKTAPAVVSIVVSKEVPDLSVTYVNPFGDNPLFKNFDFRIPVWKQRGSSRENVAAGSGFLVTKNGYLLTNRHVVDDKDASYTVLLSDGTQKDAKVVYKDNRADVAILKVDGNYPTIASIGDSANVKLGQTVIAIGNALGQYSNSVSVGIISGLDRTVQASDMEGNVEKLTGVFQTDAPINMGNSGGPLVDLNGNVVGINVAMVYGSNNISFSIPIDEVKDILRNVQ